MKSIFKSRLKLSICAVILVVWIFCIVGVRMYGPVPVLVEQVSLQDITQIENPQVAHTYYGQMRGFPHTYEIRATEPFVLYAEIRVPSSVETTPAISGIIIKEGMKGGRVTEVARMRASDAGWEEVPHILGGDTYRQGPVFGAEVESGVYRVEVHTMDNVEQYVLTLGKREEMSLSYSALIKRILAIKEFFGKSPYTVLESPLVSVPLTGLLYILGALWYKRKRAQVTVHT